MRTFQFSDAKSHKFWNIEVTGNSFTVTFGKIGTKGQSQTKTFPTPEKAQTEADKLIREKTGKGYVETTPEPGASEADAFEAAIRANPHDVAGIAAYADFLMERDDPRGEFMQVQLALENESLPASERKKLRKRESELLKAHEKEWVGDWAGLFPAPTDTEGRGQINHTGGEKYQFKRGLLTTANFGYLNVNAARAFVRAPQTRFVSELFIGYHEYDDEYEPGPDIPADVTRDDDYPADHVILRWPYMRHVRRFQYGWIADEVYEGDWCNFQCHLTGTHVHDFVKQMPDVEEVLIFAHVRDATKLVALPMPNLRVFQLYHGWSYPLDRLAKNTTLTNLTQLLCHPHALEGGDEPYIGLSGLRAVCRAKHLTALRHLRLRLANFGDEGIGEIISSGVLKRLKVLDLKHGTVTDEGARALAACPDVKNLDRLDLSWNQLTDEGVAALKGTGVNATLDRQQGADTEPWERFCHGDYE